MFKVNFDSLLPIQNLLQLFVKINFFIICFKNVS